MKENDSFVPPFTGAGSWECDKKREAKNGYNVGYAKCIYGKQYSLSYYFELIKPGTVSNIRSQNRH
jgi:hypothetical protein